MPKILRILNRLIIGGPSLNATYLTKYMAPDYETLLVIGGKDNHEQDATFLADNLGIEPLVVPSMKRAINISEDRKAYREIKNIIKKFKPDIVHTHAAKSGAIGRLAAAACKVPTIVHTFHGHVFHSYFGKAKTKTFIEIEKYLAKKSSGIIAISDIQKQELGSVYKICTPEKIKVIPLGLDLDKFQQNKDIKRLAFRSKFQIEEDEIAIGIIGRIVPVKNHEMFVAAIARLLPLTKKKLRFIIVGDGDMRSNTENLIRAAGINYAYFPENKNNAQAICTSWQTEMDYVLAGLDIVALSSHNEGTPVSLIEAQAAGKSVVSTNVGGVADAVLNGESGFITPPGDSNAFCDALLHLVEQESLRVDFGEVGRNFVQSKFSYQRLVREMDHYYQELAQHSKTK